MTQEYVVQGRLLAGSPLRTPRAAALAGIVFSVLLSAALVLLRLSAPGRTPGGRDVADRFRDAGGRESH